MHQIISPSQKAASALRRAERALQNWQDDPNSPRHDVDRMIAIVNDLRMWVQGHVLSDIERVELGLEPRDRSSQQDKPEKPV